MHRRFFKSVYLLLGVLLLAGSIGSTAAAQSTPASEPTVEELQAQVEELQAQVEALQKENEKLKLRISDLSGKKETADTSNGTDTESTYVVGDTYASDDWSITVTGVEIAPTITSSYETNTSRGVYALVYFTVTNEGNAPVAFPYEDLRLTDSDGRNYTVDSDSLFNLTYVIYEVGSQYDELQPGLPYTTAVAFDIPATATGLSFTSSGKSFIFELD